MPVSFSFYMDAIDAKSTVRQLLVREVLLDSKSIKGNLDFTHGQTAQASLGGLRSLGSDTIRDTEVVFVADSGFYPINDSDYGLFIEFMLNGKFFRLTSGYCSGGISLRETYPPLKIKPINIPTRMKTWKPQIIPAAMNDVEVPRITPQPQEIVSNSSHVASDTPVCEQPDQEKYYQF